MTSTHQYSYATPTQEGIIPHKAFKSFRLPVKLDFSQKYIINDGQSLYAPLRRNGRLVFALPGGGEYVE